MAKWYLGKRKWLLVGIAIALIGVLLAVLAFQESVSSHMYPLDQYHGNSNLAVKGVITSIQNNFKVDGMVMGSYHIFHSYVRLNITDILWVGPDLAEWISYVNESNPSSYENNILNGLKSIGIGYDNLNSPQISIGQTVECKGDYVATTDSPYSFKINVSPAINGSYLIIA